MEQVWFRPLVWTDYRLAVVFTVIMPLILTIWAASKQSEPIIRLLIIYWRVASLLMVTVYLMIASWPIGFLTGIAARLLIPLSLWFWVDLNDEIRDLRKTRLKLVLTSWRWAVSIYCLLGFMGNLPFISCAFEKGAVETPYCQVWLEAPWKYKEILHSDWSTGFTGFLGIVGLIIYVSYLLYFVVIRLSKQGRSAIEQ